MEAIAIKNDNLRFQEVKKTFHYSTILQVTKVTLTVTRQVECFRGISFHGLAVKWSLLFKVQSQIDPNKTSECNCCSNKLQPTRATAIIELSDQLLTCVFIPSRVAVEKRLKDENQDAMLQKSRSGRRSNR